MNVLFEIVRQSLATLWAHKLRSFLTMFGIAWGVGSLLLLVGLGEGFRSGQVRNLATLGQDIMFIYSGRIPAVPGSLQSGQTYHFTYEDYLAIRNEARTLRFISPVINREDIRAVSDYGSTNGQVLVASEYDQIRSVPLGTGRWLNDEDNTERRRVAVVGWELLKNVFPGRPAVGASMLLNGIRFDVIGVLAKVGKDGNNGTNARIFVPGNHAQSVSSEAGELRGRSLVHQLSAAGQSRAHAFQRRGSSDYCAAACFDPKLEDAFEDWDTIENSQRVGKIFDAMDYFLGVVGFVTLALGAIGIVNIMLVSVAERTREIGLRKALGATYQNILTQFFIEGAFLTVFSGGIGLLIATAFVTALAQLPAPQGFDTPRIVPMSALVAILSLAVAGVVAGIYPARKAALLAPVEAMRQE